MNSRLTGLVLLVFVPVFCGSAEAQGLNYSTPGTPRLAEAVRKP